MGTYTLSQLVTESSRRYPTRPAVVCGEHQLTYAQLDEQSSRLAAWLCSVGAGRGERVGLYLPKSIEAAVGVVGALKAGAAYVPIDPMAPAARVRYLIQDAEFQTLITSPQQLDVLRQLEPVALPYLVMTNGVPSTRLPWPKTALVSWGDVGAAKPGSLGDPTIETDLAYILYTSGSTGNPKGVMITHRNSLTFVNWCQQTFQLRPEDRVSSHAPFHFDLSIFDLYVAWGAGACVYLIPEELNVFPASLAEFIEHHQLSVWYSVPSALTRMLLHGQLERRDLQALRIVLFAGEVFPTKYLRRLKALVPHAVLSNLYGPTETNVCTYYHVTDLPTDDATTIPIGRGCENTEVFAVNEQGDPIQPGEVGELYVRGSAVARGYWKHPEKTKQVFVTQWLRPELGEEVVYKTGDLVRLDPDGRTYHFLGRKDHMVKSRGYRIELGEIETALYSHPAVREAAVVAVPDEEIGNRLKAFVVGQPGVVSEALVEFIAQRLPRYMIPESIRLLEQLPKTSTGKVDKQRLQSL